MTISHLCTDPHSPLGPLKLNTHDPIVFALGSWDVVLGTDAKTGTGTDP